ncbi:MAG: hypothetical protein MZW92_40440 [Comamonadaceae bacterium]|nr:hypothetical protein [Comamonadaceae bacterium]
MEVLATTTFSGEPVPAIKGVVMPVVWRKLYGQGRVFNSHARPRRVRLQRRGGEEIMKRGLLWAARVDAATTRLPTNPYRPAAGR